jgi:hypothetical protein
VGEAGCIELGVEVQSGYFVLVLVGQQLVEAEGQRFGQLGVVSGDTPLGVPPLLDHT